MDATQRERWEVCKKAADQNRRNRGNVAISAEAFVWLVDAAAKTLDPLAERFDATASAPTPVEDEGSIG